LAGRNELGEHMQPALVDSFASQITEEIRRQVAVASRPAPPRPTGQLLALAILSLGVLIPLVSIAIGTGYAAMLLLLVPAVVAINVTFAWALFRR
jgi:hypothetical protein